jgi:histidinol-phosphate aminotransferase
MPRFCRHDSDLSSLALPHVAKLHAYTPGLQPTEPGWTKLNTNECPYAPSPRVAEALRREIGEDGGGRCASIPIPRALPCARPSRPAPRRARGERLCRQRLRRYSEPAHPRLLHAGFAAAGFTLPSYSLYPVLVEIQDGATNVIEFDRAMRFAGGAHRGLDGARVFPDLAQCPDGRGVCQCRDLERVLATFRGLLVVDEAYAPFRDGRTRCRCWRVTRISWSCARSRKPTPWPASASATRSRIPTVIGLLDRVRDSYNVNRLSQAAALAAMGDDAYYDRRHRENHGHARPLHPDLDHGRRTAGSPIRIAVELHFHRAVQRPRRARPGGGEVRLRLSLRAQSPGALLPEPRLDRLFPAHQRRHR